MDFDELVCFIKMDGCPVRLYNKSILKIAQSIGTFDVSKNGNPIISMAIKGHTKLELKRILLHEYAHYLQWVDGFMDEAESNIKGWDILDKWLSGKNYTKQELFAARNCVILLEYDAEIRTIQLARNLDINLGSEKDFLNSAHSYVTFLKYVFLTREWASYDILDLCHKKLRPQEILLPLSKSEIRALKG